MNATATGPYAGDAAARVIRALLDFRSLWTTHDLVTTSGVPAPSVRRIIDALDQEDLVERRAPGVVTVPSWLALLRRWNEDFRFTQTTHLTYWRTTRRPTPPGPNPHHPDPPRRHWHRCSPPLVPRNPHRPHSHLHPRRPSSRNHLGAGTNQDEVDRPGRADVRCRLHPLPQNLHRPPPRRTRPGPGRPPHRRNDPPPRSRPTHPMDAGKRTRMALLTVGADGDDVGSWGAVGGVGG